MYEFINKEAADELRAQRIHHLEAQHYRLMLELEETPGNERIVAEVAEVERRIELHRRVLGLTPLATPEQNNGQSTDDVISSPAEPVEV